MSLIENDADEIFQADLTIIQPTLPVWEPLNLAGIINAEGESNEPLYRLIITRFTKLNSSIVYVSFRPSRPPL